MTFEEWWNKKFPYDDFDVSRFKQEFEEAWEDGYKVGYTERDKASDIW